MRVTALWRRGCTDKSWLYLLLAGCLISKICSIMRETEDFWMRRMHSSDCILLISSDMQLLLLY